MKLILLEDVDTLGKAGDIIEVKDGHARNFLMPKDLALEATSANIKIAEKRKQKQKVKIEKAKLQATELAKKISTTSCISVIAFIARVKDRPKFHKTSNKLNI